MMIHINFKRAANLLFNPTSPWLYLLVAFAVGVATVILYVPGVVLLFIAKLFTIVLLFVFTAVDFFAISAEHESTRERKQVATWLGCRPFTLPAQGSLIHFIAPMPTGLLANLLILLGCVQLSRYFYIRKILS
jgi:amino acid transporter